VKTPRATGMLVHCAAPFSPPSPSPSPGLQITEVVPSILPGDTLCRNRVRQRHLLAALLTIDRVRSPIAHPSLAPRLR